MRIRHPGLPLLLAVGVAVLASGCRTTGEFVSVDDLPPQTAPGAREYVLQAGDGISIRVWGQESMSTKTKVRPDGKVSVPFAGEIQAAGVTPAVLARNIQAGLKDVLVNPVVTVTLDEPRPLLVSVLGEVAKPGAFQLEQGAGVLQAIAMAGGMTPFASKDAIMVIRQSTDGTKPLRIRFSYESLVQLKGQAASFRLRGGDVVVVE